jgi:hypothetical protein
MNNPANQGNRERSPFLQLCYDLSVQRMISNDQKIPVRILPGFIGGHGNHAELLSHQAADDVLPPAPDAGY